VRFSPQVGGDPHPVIDRNIDGCHPTLDA